MSYDFYDDYDEDYDYYYNSAREKAIVKNENLVWLGERMKSSMCRIGQRKVKLLLNSLIKKGDSVAKMYRLILEAENHNINAKKYRNTMSFSYKDDYYEKKREVIEELIKEILEYNKTHDEKIVFGRQGSDVMETSLIVYFELPDCEQISFHTDISNGLLASVPRYEKEWDGKVNTTLPKIEDAINKRYSTELYEKYKDEIDAYEEAERLKEERRAQIRREQELREQKERERVESLMSMVIEGVVWNDLKEYVLSKKDANIVKVCIQKLSVESKEKFTESYIDSIDLKFPDVQEDNIDDLNAAMNKFNSLFINHKIDVLGFVDNTIRNRLVDELTSSVIKFNSGASGDTGTIKMFIARCGQWRYLLDGVCGKYTLFFDSKIEPSELSLASYKMVTSKESKKIGNPKRDIPYYLNTIINIKKEKRNESN